MDRRKSVIFTTGLAGSGKTYVRGVVEMLRFMCEEDGLFISNFPLKVHEVSEECSRRTGRPVEEFSRRLVVLPHQVLDGWMHIWTNSQADNSRGIWTLFAPIPWEEWEKDNGRTWSGWLQYENKDLPPVYDEWLGSFRPDLIIKVKDRSGQYVAAPDLDCSHIAIDECHHFCSSTGRTPKQQRIKWQSFLSEIRHMGATIEFISQNKDKVADEIQGEAHVNYELTNCDVEIDPFFKISMSSWYELMAAFTGVYEQRVRQTYKVKEDRIWVNKKSRTFVINPKYFKFYDSYSTPHYGGKSGRGVKHVYETKSVFGVVLWFLRTNFFTIFFKVIIAVVVWWLCFGGGIKHSTAMISNVFKGMAPKGVSPGSVDSEQVSNVAPGVPSSVRQVIYKIPDGVQEKLQEYERMKIEQAREKTVLLITRYSVILSDYKEYFIGSVVEIGDESFYLIGVDMRKRCVYLSPDKTLYMN